MTVGGVAAANITVVDATTLTATTPAHAPGRVDVVVTKPDHNSMTWRNGVTYADVIYQVHLPIIGR